jgi:hypothetical protein
MPEPSSTLYQEDQDDYDQERRDEADCDRAFGLLHILYDVIDESI